MTSISATINDDIPLPPLREELKLLKGPASFDGSPTWNIFDPVRKRYYRVGWLAFQLLSRWNSGNSGKLLRRIGAETTAELTIKDVQEFIKFLYGNSLTRDSISNSSNEFMAQYHATRVHWLMWLLKNYLFMRIPLVRPNKFIRATLPYVEWIFTRTFRVIIIACGIVGLYLTTREWDAFMSTFLYFFNMEGLVFYMLALFFLKIFHELGHAYVAARYGCHVTTMGVALLVMFPVLYTDTTDTWRLESRRQRILVGAAGMIAEIYIALLATFLWSFLPDGMLKSIAFVIATTSWIMSVAINTNIFMRFDGYYILSDFWGIENLQERAFAFGRWRMREVLFGLKIQPPEILHASMVWRLTLYAWGLWIYRAILYIGIALVVYHFFFKLLGIILFLVEIVWFILQPVYSELKIWWELRDKIIRSRHFRYFTLSMIIFALALLFPFRTTLSIPAVLKTATEVTLYSLAPGKIISVNVESGAAVNKGDVMLVLESHYLENQIMRTRSEIDVVSYRIDRRVANPEDLAETLILVGRLHELQSSLKGLLELKDTLTIRAPISGIMVDVETNLHPGRWINEELRLLTLIDPESVELTGIIDANNLNRIEKNQYAVFMPEQPEIDEIETKITEIEDTNVRNIVNLYMASTYGGKIAVRKDQSGHLIPENSSYRVKFRTESQDYPVNRVLRGQIYIAANQQSLVEYVYDTVAAVIIRETGF
jgi:putative peptide zinc metalloprotease protein